MTFVEPKAPKYRVYVRKSVELVIEVEAESAYDAARKVRYFDSDMMEEVPLSESLEIIDATLVE